METSPLSPNDIPKAAARFVDGYRTLRRHVPDLPETMEDLAGVAKRLTKLMSSGSVTGAFEDGRLMGYLGGWMVDQFRGTDHRAAYCPEWAHAAVPDAQAHVYPLLYRAASAEWHGCQTHAITLLAYPREAVRTWFWNGFGLAVVDAIRTLDPLGPFACPSVEIRRAQPADADLLAVLEAEHWRHYAEPPIFMAAQNNDSAEVLATLLGDSQNGIWWALSGGKPVGYIRFEAGGADAASVVEAETTVAVTGVFVRPPLRGRGIAPALLAAGLQEYAEMGFRRCAVDFESFNPEAAQFWMKYFEPVCFSLLRVPERHR